ncbi:hypothetical protein DKE52_008100 [Acinetobacter pittii]|uniref:Uncharacterized protein n=1 Tax=Acinetobacter pittii TaxID=48296 RepID=A0A3G6YK09_ACIPI|nr:hypothetical protein DKE52_008100 [Acinetobacter pittii]
MPYKRLEIFENKEFADTPIKVDAYYIFYGDDINTGKFTASLIYKPKDCIYEGDIRSLSNLSSEHALSDLLEKIRRAYDSKLYNEIISDWQKP